MIAKLKISVDRVKLKKIFSDKKELIARNIVTVIRQEAIPNLISRIMVGYDSLIERAAMLPEDPTNPVHWREDFYLKLRQDLEDNFTVLGNRVIIRLGDKEFLGYDPSGESDPQDSTPTHWLVYYIEGLVGDWAFISPETYERFRGSSGFKNWGRFGLGFMISKERYIEEGWEKLVPFEQVRHPFSGYAPLDIFDEALREWQLTPYIQKAIDAALRGKRL